MDIWLTYSEKKVIKQLFEQHSFLDNPISWRMFISCLWQIIDGAKPDALAFEPGALHALIGIARTRLSLRRRLADLRALDQRIIIAEQNAPDNELVIKLRRQFRIESAVIQQMFIDALRP